jgi:hypothetical protein
MTPNDVRAAAAQLVDFHERFASLFGKEQAQDYAYDYLKGLMVCPERKSIEPIALLVLLLIQPEHGGRVRIGDKGYLEGAPDLVAEIASSSASYDLGSKLKAYRRDGVREYLVRRVLDRQIDWSRLNADRYEPLQPEADGTLRSTVFPGLWLDPAALIQGDVNAVFAVVQQGLNAPEHAGFVAELERAPIPSIVNKPRRINGERTGRTSAATGCDRPPRRSVRTAARPSADSSPSSGAAPRAGR